jgi:hypothetical protein
MLTRDSADAQARHHGGGKARACTAIHTAHVNRHSSQPWQQDSGARAMRVIHTHQGPAQARHMRETHAHARPRWRSVTHTGSRMLLPSQN